MPMSVTPPSSAQAARSHSPMTAAGKLIAARVPACNQEMPKRESSLTAVLDHFLGFAWTIGIFTGAIVAFFSVLVVTERRKRRAWQATRGSGT